MDFINNQNLYIRISKKDGPMKNYLENSFLFFKNHQNNIIIN